MWKVLVEGRKKMVNIPFKVAFVQFHDCNEKAHMIQ